MDSRAVNSKVCPPDLLAIASQTVYTSLYTFIFAIAVQPDSGSLLVVLWLRKRWLFRLKAIDGLVELPVSRL